MSQQLSFFRAVWPTGLSQSEARSLAAAKQPSEPEAAVEEVEMGLSSQELEAELDFQLQLEGYF